MTAPTITAHPMSSPTPPTEVAAQLENPGFGRTFTDHMVRAEYIADRGWHSAELCARAPVTLETSASVFHYGQAVFEGLKVYRQPDSAVATFRIRDHAERFNRSAARMAMPEVPVEMFEGAVEALLEHDRAWVPTKPGHTLYLRPFMFSTEPFLGVRPSHSYLFFLIASPAGDYFSGGVAPVDVWVSRDYSRAAPGGTGFAKTSGNYAASLIAQKQAIEHGCEQVIFLDAAERRYIEELGGMNVFFGMRDGDTTKLVTPPLTDTMLPGITRYSIIQLAKDRGYEVEERPIAFTELVEAVTSGRCVEAFACGTAAVITPLGTIRGSDGEWTIHKEGIGPMAKALREQLIGIQFGTEPDTHSWRTIYR